jgi:dipeptidyl aminopeptidase/acylaminoacyl peptidase
LKKLVEISPWLKEKYMADQKPITYKSRDGLTIHGYLTLPKGAVKKNFPVVINPHGGPWYRDSWGYNPEVQFLANRGYAVLQVNFRGSTGYGRKFWESSFKKWGKEMQDDITDGVKWLIKKGIADSKRIGIYGGSYGGYATLAGLAFTPDLYACGVDYVGVSSIFSWIKAFPPYWKPFLEMVYEMVGHPEKDKELLKAASPFFHVDKIKVPLFIAQGANDVRVPKAESDQMVKALKKRGIDVPYMVKENEGHGFRNEENRFDFYRAMETFLGKHLGGRVEKEKK